jgi:N-acetylglutamate synthase-like GNAT family acetyltransferase
MTDIPSLFNLKATEEGSYYEPTSVSNIWIATYSGERVGFLTVCKSGAKSCEIRKLAVLQKYRRRGFGEMMVRQAIQWAKDHDMETIFSVNIASSQIAACELFEKCNFIIAKQKPVVEGFGYLAYSLSLMN